MSMNLGHIFATIGLDTSDLKRNSKEAEDRLESLGTTMGGIGKRAAQLGAAAAVAGVAMVSALVKTGMDAIDAQNDLARSLDTNVNALRALQIAAAEAGVDSEGLNKALQMMNARLGEAQRGTGQAYEALNRLGLSARELSEMDADDRMAAIADRVRELGLSSAETADLLRDFGIRGGEMVDMLRQGGDAIRDAAGDVREFGLELSNIDVAMVDQAKESISRMGLVMEGIRNKVTVAVAPILGELADRFNDAAKASGGFGDEAVEVLRTVAKGVAYVGNFVHVLHIAFKGLETAIAGIATVSATVADVGAKVFAAMADAITSKINLIIRGINAMGGNLKELPSLSDSAFIKGFDEVLDSAQLRTKELWAETKKLASEAFPTQKVDEFFDAVERRRRAMAEDELAGRNEGGSGGDPGSPTADRELEQKRASLAQQLDAVRQHGMDEYQLLDKQLQDRMKIIREAIDQRVLAEEQGRDLVAAVAAKYVEDEQAIGEQRLARLADMEARKNEMAVREYEQARAFALSDEAAEIEEYERAVQRVIDFYGGVEQITADGQARLEELEKGHTERLFDIRTRGMDNINKMAEALRARDYKSALQYGAAATANLTTQSRTIFEINKALALASVAVATPRAIMETWANAGGYPMGIPMVAAQVAAAVAQLNAINSASFSGKGGSAPSLAGTTPAPPVTPVGGGGSQAGAGGRLIVQGIDPGALFTGRDLQALAERLLEYQRDGGTVVFGG
jgi:hypothetical protein